MPCYFVEKHITLFCFFCLFVGLFVDLFVGLFVDLLFLPVFVVLSAVRVLVIVFF